MALPAGVTTATVIAGVPVTHTGAPVKAFVSIEPSAYLVHAATGTPLVDFIEEVDISEGTSGQFILPHTDQAGFQDGSGNAYTNWYYTARVTYSTPSKAKTKAPKVKVFQLATGQTSIDLDMLPEGAPALPYTAPTAKVDAFHGRTGAVTIQESDLPVRLSEAELAVDYVPTTIIETAQPAHLTQLTTVSDSGKNGMRIVNNANSYGLKVDQTGIGGVHDAVNIAANFAGAHTPLGVVSGNTDFSTIKVTNTAAQIGGQVIAALGTDPARTAGIIAAENHGAGPAFLAVMKPTSTGAGAQIQFQDGGTAATYNSRAVWVQARHTAGDTVYIENAADVAQTSGSLVHITQPNTGSTAPCLTLSPFGTGPGLKINASGASILAQIGNNFSVDSNGTVRPSSIVNGVSFNNASITPGTTGTVVTRNVADNQPVMQVKNTHATSTGDIMQFIGIAGASITSRVDRNGYLMTRKNTAPADADLAVGEAAIWIDPTPGTGGVRWKIKATDGSIINKTL